MSRSQAASELRECLGATPFPWPQAAGDHRAPFVWLATNEGAVAAVVYHDDLYIMRERGGPLRAVL
jgi:hypothetical protein